MSRTRLLRHIQIVVMAAAMSLPGAVWAQAVPLVVGKSFSSTDIAVSQTATLTITAQNIGRTVLTSVAFTDTYPAGMSGSTTATATPAGCAGTLSATATGLAVSGGVIAPLATCTYSVVVTGVSAGAWNNSVTLNALTPAGAPVAGTATATLNVYAPPTVTKSFGPNAIGVGGTSTLTITVTNPAANPGTVAGISIGDNYTGTLVNNGTGSLACGLGATATLTGGANGGTSVGLAAGSFRPGTSCAITQSVTATTTNVNSTTAPAATTPIVLTGTAASARLDVYAPPTAVKTFTPATIGVGGTSSMVITVTNPATNPGNLIAVSIDDIYTGTLSNNAAGAVVCSGAGSATLTGGANAGTNVGFTGGTIVPGGTCTITQSVTATTTNTNTTTAPDAKGPPAVTGTAASATLTVGAAPTVAKAFAAGAILTGGNTNLTVTLGNPNTFGAIALTSALTDNFPVGMTIGTAGNAGTCTGVTATAGATGFTVANGRPIPPGGCTVIVNVTSGTVGAATNTIAAGALQTTTGNNAAAASATLNVFAPPTAVKTFTPSTITAGGTSSMVITVTNPAANPGNLTGVSINDAYVGTLTNNAAGSVACSGAGTATLSGGVNGGTSVGFNAGTIAPGGTCTITQSVSASSTNNNTTTAPAATGPLTAAGTAASATLTVTPLVPVLTATPAAVPSFGSVLVGSPSAPQTITLANTGTGLLTFTGLPGVTGDFARTATTCLTTLAAGDSCTVTVVFTPTATGVRTGNFTVASDGGTVTRALTGTGLASGPVVNKSFVASNVALGGTTTMNITVQNPAANTFALAGVAFTDTYPAGMTGALTATASPAGCTGTLTALAGSLALTGGTVPVNTTCTYSVVVTGAAAGSLNNSTGTVTTTNAGNGGPANATLTVTAALTPRITLSATSFNFPNQTVGTTSTPQTLTVTSTGTAPLVITGVAVTGDFAVTSPCTAASPLAPAATCPVSITFSPLIPGARTGNVTVTSNDAGTPASVVALAGTGVAAPLPGVAIVPATLAFPTLRPGEISASQSATLTNTGAAALSIASIAITGSGFSVTNNCPATLTPGASCLVTANFMPIGPGNWVTDVNVFSNAPGSPTLLRLTGTAAVLPFGLLAAEPEALMFSDQIIGTTSAPKSLVLRNVGNATVAIADIAVSGDFAKEGACPTLGPGESCAFRATFSPTDLGVRAGRILFTSDALNTPYAVGLNGRGVPAPVPRVQLSASTVGFGNRLVGTTTVNRITVTNVGSTNLVFGAFTVTGDFAIQNPCSGLLAPDQSCAFDVAFNPSLSGPRPGALTFVSNAEGSPHRVDLAGTGCRNALVGRSLSFVCTP